MAEDLKVQTPDGIREIAVEEAPDRAPDTAVDQRMQIVAGSGPVRYSNPLPTSERHSEPANGSTTSRRNAATFAQEMLGVDPDRKSFMIYNEGPGKMYVAFHADASPTDYTFALNPGDFYESSTPAYSGVVSAAWSETGGFAQVTSTMVL